MTIDLTTRYLGLTLAHPFIAGASPLADTLDSIKRLEDGGSAAIVLRSLFEEQITMARTGKIHRMDPVDRDFAELLAGFPRAEQYALVPDAYLDHIRRAKDAVDLPIIASLNGVTAESWLTFAQAIENAGADALELNMYEFVSGVNRSASAVERQIRVVVKELAHGLRIPVSVKLTAYFTAFGYLARQLDEGGAAGLVLFNRFLQPDVDVDTLTSSTRFELSTNAELPLRLRWLAVLHDRLHCSLALTGGVDEPRDGVKAILAGAHAVQMVSAILRHGPKYFSVMRDGLVRWMESKNIASIDEVRGRVHVRAADLGLVERADYIQTLQSWSEERAVRCP